MSHAIHVLGIRHHGPGSARSVLRALDELRPDCVLIEGPPDADALIPHAAKADMVPPVALLVYDAADPASAVYYPFAEFSPEWQAIRWALAHDVPVTFMDLPQAHRMAVRAERLKRLAEEFKAAEAEAAAKAEAEKAEQAAAAGRIDAEDAGSDAGGPGAAAADTSAGEDDEADPPASAGPPPPLVTAEHDPLGQLAKAAGFDDGERWWEHVVEHRRDQGVELFAAIRDAMAELRAGRSARAVEAVDAAAGERDDRGDGGGDGETVSSRPSAPTRPPADADEPLREAWMRRTIRAARADGFANVAVVCGAWHAPALDVDGSADAAFPPDADDDLLKKLPRVKTAATWVPWTYDHLAFASGYGAGVHSPGWYDHLWHQPDSGRVLPAWMAKVAGLLRSKDIDCSSAHVIEAVRLGTTLATLRGRPLADLSDIADATRSVFCHDSDAAMRLIEQELLVGHRLGEVPADTPMVPLAGDLLAQQKKLRLKPEASEKPVDLDLRTETDRGRSVLLHRLRLLEVDWGTPDRHAGQGKGTFHEHWRLRWDPGYAVKLIEAGRLGNTIEAAAGAALAKTAADTHDLKKLADQLQDAMLADLGDAARALVRHIEDVAAVATDVALLMATLPPLASLVRYGNVRRTDEGMVRHIVDGIFPRIAAGLGPAVASLNDEAAGVMHAHLVATGTAVEQLDDPQHAADWLDALARVIEHDTVHGLVRGRAARQLLDAGRLDAAGVARRLGLTLGGGADPRQGARWLEGFLGNSGLLLIHDPRLLVIIDAWVGQIRPDGFDELLPLLRRTFSAFPAPERRQVGQLLAKGTVASSPAGPAVTKGAGGRGAVFNDERAARALPLLRTILGGR